LSLAGARSVNIDEKIEIGIGISGIDIGTIIIRR